MKNKSILTFLKLNYWEKSQWNNFSLLNHPRLIQPFLEFIRWLTRSSSTSYSIELYLKDQSNLKYHLILNNLIKPNNRNKRVVIIVRLIKFNGMRMSSSFFLFSFYSISFRKSLSQNESNLSLITRTKDFLVVSRFERSNVW